jgi:hypothetical protein
MRYYLFSIVSACMLILSIITLFNNTPVSADISPITIKVAVHESNDTMHRMPIDVNPGECE